MGPSPSDSPVIAHVDLRSRNVGAQGLSDRDLPVLLKKMKFSLPI